MEYLGKARFWGSGRRMRKGSFGWVYRWRDGEEYWELRCWEEEGAIRGDEDEAPCVLLRNGEEVEEFGSFEEFWERYGFPLE